MPRITGKVLAQSALRFGEFELDADAGELRKNGRRLKVQPQPFKLLVLLVRRAGTVVSRDDIRQELWSDGTFVDFDQAMNFAIKQVRDVLHDSAEQPLFIETVPRRGYRFIAPLEPVHAGSGHLPVDGTTTVRLQKALWTNIAELRVSEARRRRLLLIVIVVLTTILIGLIVYLEFIS
jgi:DNA-binding winged helix-turn-helix (wHTH) protein